MTPAAERTLIRIARHCAKHRNWRPLVAWVEAYDARPRSPVSTDAAAGHGRPGSGISSPVARRSADRATQQPDTGLRRFLAWLR